MTSAIASFIVCIHFYPEVSTIKKEPIQKHHHLLSISLLKEMNKPITLALTVILRNVGVSNSTILPEQKLQVISSGPICQVVHFYRGHPTGIWERTLATKWHPGTQLLNLYKICR